MRQHTRDELFRLRTRNQRAPVALEREVAKVPLADDILHRLALHKPRHAAAHSLEELLADLLFEMRGKCAAPCLEQSCREKLGGDCGIRHAL